MNASKLAVPALCVGLLGVVGGVAAAQVFQPTEKPAPVVNIAPAAETVTPTVEVTVTPSATSTTVAPEPVKSVKVAVPSKPKATTTSAAPQTVQRQAIVSETPADPTPAQTQPAPAAPSAPKVKWGAGGPPTNQVGGVGVTPTPPPSK